MRSLFPRRLCWLLYFHRFTFSHIWNSTEFFYEKRNQKTIRQNRRLDTKDTTVVCTQFWYHHTCTSACTATYRCKIAFKCIPQKYRLDFQTFLCVLLYLIFQLECYRCLKKLNSVISALNELYYQPLHSSNFNTNLKFRISLKSGKHCIAEKHPPKDLLRSHFENKKRVQKPTEKPF